MADKPSEERKLGLSFGFSKKQEVKQLSKSIASENVEKEDTETDFVLSFEGRKVKSTKGSSEPSKKEYIIPLIKQNNWRIKDETVEQDEGKAKSDRENLDSNLVSSDNLDELAAKEILQDTAKYNEEWEDRGKEGSTVAIPLLMQNKVPMGFESDDKLDVALRPDEPQDADYEQIPIEHFGMAMLRGMGWNEKRGIGKTGQVIAPVEAHLRPKGLGLGADRNNSGPDKKSTSNDKLNDKEDDLILKKGAFCVVTSGVNKDLYGSVEGIDEDNSRVMVKLTLSGKVVNIMQCSVRVVTKKEFDKFSKYLNKQKADKYKEDEEKRMENGDVENGDHRESHRSKSHKHHKRKKEYSDNDSDGEISKRKSKKHKSKRDRNKEQDHVLEKGDSERNRKSGKDYKDSPKHSNSKYKSNSDRKGSDSEMDHQDDSVSGRNVPPWLRNDLRVRIIDKNLKKGKYYKEKVVIIDVPALGKCVCRTDDGKVIEDIPQSSLETVIPRSDSVYVAIVSGSYRGQIGQVMKRDKDQCLALVQLLSDRDVVLKLLYDDICEFVGNIHQHDDY